MDKVQGRRLAEATELSLRPQQRKVGQSGRQSADEKEALRGNGADTVDISLAKAINEASTNPRVAELKALIDAGKYDRSSEEIARRVGEVIEEEIFFAKLAGIDE